METFLLRQEVRIKQKKKKKLYEVERRGNFVKIPTNFILKTFLVNVVEFVVYFESL